LCSEQIHPDRSTAQVKVQLNEIVGWEGMKSVWTMSPGKRLWAAAMRHDGKRARRGV
jgi:hypothetical protein